MNSALPSESSHLLNVAGRFRFQPQGIVRNGLRVICCEEGEFKDTIELFVEGIPIGKKIVSEYLKLEQKIDIPIERFPLVGLPVAIRIKSSNESIDKNAEVIINTPEQALFIAGPGIVTLDEYFVETGYINIYISNTTNGLWPPNVFVRFDSGVTRTAVVENIRRREEGGCQAQLRVPLYIGDLQQAGFSLEIFCADRDGALGQIEYRRVDPQSQASLVAHVAADLRSLLAVQTLRIAAMESDYKKSLGAMNTRLETFCEYILSITHDLLVNGSDRSLLPQEGKKAFGVASAAEQLFSDIKIESSSAQISFDPQDATKRFVLPINDEYYFEGWHVAEIDKEGGHFRWMERAGQIKLPCSVDVLNSVVVSIGKIFGNLLPVFSAKINGVRASLRCFVVSNGFELHITPSPAQDAMGFESCILTLDSAVWGSPFDEGIGSDRRELSALVRSVEVFTNEQDA